MPMSKICPSCGQDVTDEPLQRTCSICGQPVGTTGYQLPQADVLIDNIGQDVERDMVDVCKTCMDTRQTDVTAKLTESADAKLAESVEEVAK